MQSVLNPYQNSTFSGSLTFGKSDLNARRNFLNEIAGNGNSYDYGFRMYNPRIGRFLTLDSKMKNHPSESSYSAFRNSPILYIDHDGNEWVNAHTARVKELEQQALDNPDNKQIARDLEQEKLKEARVAKYIKTLQENDVALYNYIDNLKVTTTNYEGEKGEKNIKVYVSSDPSIEGNNGQVAETITDIDGRIIKDVKVKYNGKDIVSPQGENGYNTIDIKIYGKTSYGDERLSDEAGDVMNYMENNEEALKENNAKDFQEGGKEQYLESQSREYSNKVYETYMKRKKDGTGKNINNNPYPLKMKE